MTGYPQAIVPVDHVEPVPRRVRAMLGGQVVLDTTRALYLWEWPFYPQFQIPANDVDAAALIDEEHTHRISRGTVARVGLRAGGVDRPGAGRRYVETTAEGLAGTIRFDWAALDAWFEEDEEIFVHPRNPYVRVDALRSTRTVRVELEGIVLAESGASVMAFETGLPTRYYVDRSAVDFASLRASDTVTSCPHKGRTTGYWSVQTPDALHADLAWTYDFPTRQLLPIAGMIAFYNENVDIYLDGQLEPRPATHFFDSGS
ncbi:MAG: DUF427 domain-containing protein [Solirubrobacteraceae bacterium]